MSIHRGMIPRGSETNLIDVCNTVSYQYNKSAKGAGVYLTLAEVTG